MGRRATTTSTTPSSGSISLERHGIALQPEDVAAAWLAYLPFQQVFTAERVVYRNIVRGVPVRSAAVVDNPYREWIGALIRGDIFGWIYPGRPRAAAILAHRDASLSHVSNGIYGEMWAAALVAGAFVATDTRDAVERSLDHVPSGSRLAEAVRAVLEMQAAGDTWDLALAAIQSRYGHYSWCHVVNNAAIIAAGLLWGEGDVTRTIGLTVHGRLGHGLERGHCRLRHRGPGWDREAAVPPHRSPRGSNTLGTLRFRQLADLRAGRSHARGSR